MKAVLKVSGPIKDPESISDIGQPAKQWIASMIAAIGDQMKAGGETSIRIEIDGFEFEFSVRRIPGIMETHRVKASFKKDRA